MLHFELQVELLMVFSRVNSKGNISKTKYSSFEGTRRFVFLKNRFHMSGCTESNQNKRKEQNIMVDCAESVKSIFEAARMKKYSLCNKINPCCM